MVLLKTTLSIILITRLLVSSDGQSTRDDDRLDIGLSVASCALEHFTMLLDNALSGRIFDGL